MKHYLIKSINCIVSDAEIKELDWYLYFGKIYRFSPDDNSDRPSSIKNGMQKIEYSNNNLEGLKPFELIDEEGEKDLFYNKQVLNPYPTNSLGYGSWEKGFIAGYKAKAGYTLFDVLGFVEWTQNKEYMLIKDTWYHEGHYTNLKTEELLTLYLQEQESRPIEVIQISENTFKIK